MSDLALTKKSETTSKITFTYPKVAGCEGYQYIVNGSPVSRTFDPDDLEVTFGKVSGATYRVVPVDVVQRVDGFVWPAPTTYTVTQNVIGSGGAVSGTYGWAATPSDVSATAKIEFLIDGAVKGTDTSSPYGYVLDTKTLTDGVHTWVVKATASDGRVATVSEQVTVDNETAPPPPPPPPPDGSLMFVGDWTDPANPYKGWKEVNELNGGGVVDTPAGKSFMARIMADGWGASICHVGNQFADYQLPFEVIPADVWHDVDVLVPSGNAAGYPGVLTPATPGSGWNVIWEVHNRTDSASGYDYPGTTPGSYVSTVLTVKSENDGSIRWQLRISGGTLTGPVHLYSEIPSGIVRDRWYKHQIRLKHGHTSSNGYFEWWVDNVRVAAAATPTAYLCDDGKSGERLQVGLYRGGANGVSTVYLKGMKVSTTRAALAAAPQAGRLEAISYHVQETPDKPGDFEKAIKNSTRDSVV